MRRTFLDLSASPARSTTLETPDPEVFGDHVAAIESYLATIDDLLARGYLELPPRLHYRRGSDSFEIALPCHPELTWVERFGGEPPRIEVQRHGSIIEAIYAYNAYIRARIAEGFALLVPEWPSTALPATFELHTVYEKDAPTQVSKRYYQRREAPNDEFGPEWWYEEGRVWQFNFQLQSHKQGPTIEVKDGAVHGLILYHRNVYQGPLYLFEADSTIKHLGLHTGGRSKSMSLSLEAGKLTLYTEDGTDEHGKNRGLWQTWSDEGRLEAFFDPPGERRWLKMYRPEDGTLSVSKTDEGGRVVCACHLDPEGRLTERHTRNGNAWRIALYHPDGVTVRCEGPANKDLVHMGRWRDYDAQGELIATRNAHSTLPLGAVETTDQENRTVKVYGSPGVFESITWYRLDGTLEQHKAFDDEEKCNLVTFHDGTGTLTQRRALREDGTWWHELFFEDGVTLSGYGTFSDGKSVGDWVDVQRDGSASAGQPRVSLASVVPGALEALFRCLEHEAYLPTPLSPMYSNLYAETTATTPNLPQTLEDHIARLYCLAHTDLEALKPAAAKAGAWKYTSSMGSKLALKRKKDQIVSGTLHCPDGALAAAFTFHPPGGPHETKLDLVLYHTDPDESPARRGSYKAYFPYDDPTQLRCRREGWWFDIDLVGRTTRAQHFSGGSNNLIADHHYTGPLYDLASLSEGLDFDALASSARALASGSASREAFLAVCRLVEQATLAHRARVVRDLVAPLREPLERWPSRLRTAPLLWINRLISGALPLQALHLVSSLSLTAAVAGHYVYNPTYPLLLAWLQRYPTDGPSLEGISLSFRDEVATALQAAKDAEPLQRFHPAKIDLDECFHLDSDDYALLFGSPLFRHVRVLDLSWSATPRSFDWDYQGIRDGRGLSLGTLARHLSSERLAVLDLHGQCNSPREQVLMHHQPTTPAMKAALRGLKVLNLGGGHPIGNSSVQSLAKLCPALEELSLYTGQAGELLNGEYDFDEWEEGTGRDSVYGRLHEHWGIYGNDDIKALRIERAGWRALARLTELRRVDLGEYHRDHAFGDNVEVTVSSSWRPAPIGEWASYFEP